MFVYSVILRRTKRLSVFVKFRTYSIPHYKFNLKLYCTTKIQNGSCQNYFRHQKLLSLLSSNLHIQRSYSKKLIDKLFDDHNENEIKQINDLFPQPRVTLNELATKTPDRIFDIHYKQMAVAPKGGNRKGPVNNDWMCTYSFIWPEKRKFECAAISKRQAAEKAAAQAVQWLYENKRIDRRGSPLYDRRVIDDLQSDLNNSISAMISQESVKHINAVWQDYENDIKSIYETTFKAAESEMEKIHAALLKDSTLDEDSEDITEDLSDPVAEEMDLRAKVHPVFGRSAPPSKSQLVRRRRVLSERMAEYDETVAPLPIDRHLEEIVSTVEESRVTVVVGSAGCGKSTRVPAAILKNRGVETAAVVSEPRRVAAIGLAQRVADEMGESVGETVGYQVRLDSRPPRPGGAVLYCTSGVLLRRLQINPGLEGCSHVIIDEAHERDVNTDLTLLLLKRALALNQQLKLIIMSATLDTAVFTRYFDECPVVQVPGRTYPVETLHLNDVQSKFNLRLPSTLENCSGGGKPHVNCQEMVEVIKAVDKCGTEGAILVFLPGWAEIKQTKLLLETHFGRSSPHMFLPVHSRLSTTEQSRMFSRAPPGVRKVVLATNIAETSVTIPDAVHVVDAGAHKENRLKETTGSASLETVWVSKAGAKQRAGRAGRVQPGFCYRLYTKEKEDEFTDHSTPEILRIPLEATVLDCKSYAPDEKIEEFLSQLPEPPSKKAIRMAVHDLMDLGALTSTEHLTRFGSLLSQMTLHPRLAAAVVHAAAVGGVVAAANVAAHCSDNVELFDNAADRREEIREIKSEFSKTSDHTALHWIQDGFEQKLAEGGAAAREWCGRRGLRPDRLAHVRAISNIHLGQVLRTGVVDRHADAADLNRYSSIDEVTVALLLSGSNCLLTTKKHVKTKGKLKTVVELFTSKGERAHISTESVNYGITKRKHSTNLLTYFGGHHSTERRALVVYKCSLIPPHTALLFSMGNIAAENMEDNESTVLCLQRHKLRVQLPTSQAEAILKAREMLWNTLKYYIQRDQDQISFDELTTVAKFKKRLTKAIGRVLVEAHKDYVDDNINLR